MIRIETSPSSRATCNNCYKKIKVDTKRLSISYQDGAYSKNYRLCERCARAELKRKLRELDK